MRQRIIVCRTFFLTQQHLAKIKIKAKTTQNIKQVYTSAAKVNKNEERITVNYQYSLCLTRKQSQAMSSTPERVDYIRKITKKDEQIRNQDELMTKGKEEILRLRAAVAELVAEKEELR